MSQEFYNFLTLTTRVTIMPLFEHRNPCNALAPAASIAVTMICFSVAMASAIKFFCFSSTQQDKVFFSTLALLFLAIGGFSVTEASNETFCSQPPLALS